jgi:hypothetical protein
VNQPKLDGFIEMQNGQAQLQEPRIAAETYSCALNSTATRFMWRLEGSLNGGSIKGEGNLNLFGTQPGASGLTVKGDGIYSNSRQVCERFERPIESPGGSPADCAIGKYRRH